MSQTKEEPPAYMCDAWCKSKVEDVTFTYVWQIDQYNLRSKQKDVAWCSEPFKIEGVDGKVSQWEIKYYPLGNSTNGSYGHESSIYFHNLSNVCGKAHFEFSILTKSNLKTKTMRSSNGAVDFGADGSLGLPIFVNFYYENPPRPSLTIIGELTILGVERSVSSLDDQNEIKRSIPDHIPVSHIFKDKHHNQISEDLKKAFYENNKDSSDVTIRCEGKEYYCHQFMLAARSPVFKVMLQTNMKEKETGSIDIDDFTNDVVEKMLLFIYTGIAPQIDEHVDDLLNIAEKYELHQLKVSVGEKLVPILNNENCIEYLVLGNLYNVKSLKEASLKLLKCNVKNIMKKENWKKELEILPSSLVCEIMEAILMK